MAIRIRPDERSTATGQNNDMERSIGISADRVGSVGLYSSSVDGVESSLVGAAQLGERYTF